MDEGIREQNQASERMLETGDYSDLTIHCGEYSWSVHKFVLCSRSVYFATALKKGAFAEGESSTIRLLATTDDGHADDLAADDPDAVDLMISFLYRHKYSASSTDIPVEQANEGVLTLITKKTVQNPRYSYQTQTVMEEKPSLNPCGDCNPLMHAKTYALGSKYSIDSLKQVAMLKFTEAVTYAWNNDTFMKRSALFTGVLRGMTEICAIL